MMYVLVKLIVPLKAGYNSLGDASYFPAIILSQSSTNNYKTIAELKKDRAAWTNSRLAFLVSMMKEYSDVGKYHGQNGWTTEGWNQVVKELNNLYQESRLTKYQVQDKDAQLKKHYKNIKLIVNRSGISWNDIACVINTTPEKWEEIIAVSFYSF